MVFFFCKMNISCVFSCHHFLLMLYIIFMTGSIYKKKDWLRRQHSGGRFAEQTIRKRKSACRLPTELWCLIFIHITTWKINRKKWERIPTLKKIAKRTFSTSYIYIYINEHEKVLLRGTCRCYIMVYMYLSCR